MTAPPAAITLADLQNMRRNPHRESDPARAAWWDDCWWRAYRAWCAANPTADHSAPFKDPTTETP